MTSGRRALGAAVAASTVAAFAAVVIPVFLIRPFRPQTPDEVAISYTLRTASPLLTVLVLVGILGATLWLWRGAKRMARCGLVALLVLDGALAWAARQNHFEWMFQPLPSPSWVPASRAGFLAPDERVLSVSLRGEAAAYPVRQLGYHHLVHDVVGGVPIVVTY